MDRISGIDPNLDQRIKVASAHVSDVKKQKDLQPSPNLQDQVIFQEPLSSEDIASALLKSAAAHQIRKLKGKSREDGKKLDRKIREAAEKICGGELTDDKFEKIKQLVLQKLQEPENQEEIPDRLKMESKIGFHGIMPIVDTTQPILEEVIEMSDNKREKAEGSTGGLSVNPSEIEQQKKKMIEQAIATQDRIRKITPHGKGVRDGTEII